MKAIEKATAIFLSFESFFCKHFKRKLTYVIGGVFICPLIINLSLEKLVSGLTDAIPTFSPLNSILAEASSSESSFFDFIRLPQLFIPFCILGGIGALILVLNYFLKPPAYRIIHYSMDNSGLAPIDPDIQKKYHIFPLEINLSPFLMSPTLSEANACRAISAQTKLLDQWKKLYKPGIPVYYTGIAHTPFIFLAGYTVSDRIAKVMALHKSVNSEFFKKLNDGTQITSNKDPYVKDELLDFSSQEGQDKNQDQLLVTFETSFEIRDKDIECFKSKSNRILRFSFKSPVLLERDSIDTVLLQSQWCFFFWEKLRRRCKDLQISTVHLVISSSSDLTFLLGQWYKNTYDPEIIVYHYCRNATPPYPWGLRIGSDVSYVSNS